MEWKEDTRVFDRMFSKIENLSSKEIKVGFFDDRYDDENDNLYVAQVAQWQEEGHKNGDSFAPPRPFFRNVFYSEVKSRKYEVPTEKLIKDVWEEKITPNAACKKLGSGLEFTLKSIIENGDMFKPNSPEWTEEKRKYYGVYLAPLNFTGKMQESVKFKITNKGGKE